MKFSVGAAIGGGITPGIILRGEERREKREKIKECGSDNGIECGHDNTMREKKKE